MSGAARMRGGETCNRGAFNVVEGRLKSCETQFVRQRKTCNAQRLSELESADVSMPQSGGCLVVV